MRTRRTAIIANILAIAVVGGGSALLSGCKADGGKPDVTRSAQSTVQVPIRSVEEGRPLIVCFGDSLTAGYGTNPGESYPDYLQQRLDADGFSYRVVNLGVSGDTTKDGLDRLPHVASRGAKVVVLEFGGNDGLRGLPLAQTRQNLDAMIQGLQNSGTRVALAGITLPPDYGPDYIRDFNAMYTALARQYRVPLLPFLLQGAFGVPGSMQDDRTHATAQGNRQVAANVEQLIKPLLHR